MDKTSATTAADLLAEAGLTKTHWGKRIIKAEQEGTFTSKDRSDSGNWALCACGKADMRIPRAGGDPASEAFNANSHHDMEPCDLRLRTLGGNFPDDIYDNKPVAAAKTLIAIETRAAALLRKQRTAAAQEAKAVIREAEKKAKGILKPYGVRILPAAVLN